MVRLESAVRLTPGMSWSGGKKAVPIPPNGGFVFERLKKRSAVGFLAILDAVDADGVGIGVREADAVVAYAETVLGWLDALELLDIPHVGLDEALEGGGDAQAGGAVESSQIGLGLIGEDELLHEGSL